MRGLIAISNFNWADERIFPGIMTFEPGDEFDPIELKVFKIDLIGMLERGRIDYGEIKVTLAEKLEFHFEVVAEEAKKELEAKKAEEKKAAEELAAKKVEEVKIAEVNVEEVKSEVEEIQKKIQEITAEEIKEDIEKARKYKSDRGLTYLVEKYSLDIPDEEDLETRREIVIDALEAMV